MSEPRFRSQVYKIFQKPLRLNEDDLVFLGLRLISIGAAILWFFFAAPSNYARTTALSVLLVFCAYSFLFYVFFLWKRKLDFHRIYSFLLFPDFVSIALLTVFTGGVSSPFIYGFYLLVAITSFYFGLWSGLLMALATFSTDFLFWFFLNGNFDFGSHVFRWGFYWVLALAIGLLSHRVNQEKKLLEKTSTELNKNVETLKLIFEIGKHLASHLELDELNEITSEAIPKAFHLSSFLFVLLEPQTKRKIWEFRQKFELEEEQKCFQLLEKLVSQEDKKREELPSFIEVNGCSAIVALRKPDAVVILSVKKDELNKLSSEDRNLLVLLATQLAAAYYNAFLYAKTKELSVTDDLTGLYNHRYFKNRLAEEIERSNRTGHPLSLILLDLDNFKKFNDTFGHLKGDEALRWVGKTLKKASRKVDIPARYGGDEFAVICPNTDLQKAIKLAQRLQRELHSIAFESAPGFFFTTSVGVATYPDHAKTLEDLVNRADEALFEAKREGKSQVKTA